MREDMADNKALVTAAITADVIAGPGNPSVQLMKTKPSFRGTSEDANI
jgi:hypothetical protein